MPTDADKKKIEKLLERDPAITERLEKARVVEDVIKRRLKKNMRDLKKDTRPIPGVNTPGVWNPYTEGTECRYLPKGRLETPDEYKRRVEMTPLFLETPGILNDRQGAIFSEPPKLKEEVDLGEFFKSATPEGESIPWCAAQVSEWFHIYGFCAGFVDKVPISPEDAELQKKGQLSEQDAKAKSYGEPRLVLYRADDILKTFYDKRGLVWIKVQETRLESSDPLQDETEVRVIRIISRTTVHTYEIRNPNNPDKWELIDLGEVEHGMVDRKGQPMNPVVIGLSPVGIDKHLADPILYGSSEADVTTTQLMSDLRWTGFLFAQPLMWKRMQKNSSEQPAEMGGTRYIPLKCGSGSSTDEEVGYCQLDTNGADLLKELAALSMSKAKEAGGKGGGEAITQSPTNEMSGISRAWKFKTEEERMLFLTTTQLTAFFDGVFERVSIIKILEPEKVKVEFNQKFDMQDPKSTADTVNSVWPRIQKIPTAKKMALQKIISLLGTPSEKDEKELSDQINKASEEEEAETPEPGDKNAPTEID